MVPFCYSLLNIVSIRYGDPEKDKGIQTTPDAKFFAISSEFPETFDNKDSDLVIQVTIYF